MRLQPINLTPTVEEQAQLRQCLADAQRHIDATATTLRDALTPALQSAASSMKAFWETARTPR